MQFVTFRLADSFPHARLRDWKEQRAAWLLHHPQPWTLPQEREYHRRFTKSFENALDEGAGSCLLKDESNRLALEQTLVHGHGKSVIHHAWVIMPNHVHLLFTPLVSLAQLMKSWKGISSRRMGAGKIWQKNYRDTMIRDRDHFINAVRYIRRNPSGPPTGTFSLWQSDRALEIP